MIAPPAPSEATVGLTWSSDAAHTVTPLAVHCAVPDPFTRWANTSWRLGVPERESNHVTMAPPAPSETRPGPAVKTGTTRVSVLVQIATPSAAHCTAPAPLMRWA